MCSFGCTLEPPGEFELVMLGSDLQEIRLNRPGLWLRCQDLNKLPAMLACRQRGSRFSHRHVQGQTAEQHPGARKECSSSALPDLLRQEPGNAVQPSREVVQPAVSHQPSGEVVLAHVGEPQLTETHLPSTP